MAFPELGLARAYAAAHLSVQLATDMAAAGAPVFETDEQWQEHTVDLSGLEMFVDGLLTLTASGRPQLASHAS